MAPRAFYKRQSRQFKPGDKVTWGNGSVPCTVIEVKSTGLVLKDLTVDTTVSRPEPLRPYFVFYEGTQVSGRKPRKPNRDSIRHV